MLTDFNVTGMTCSACSAHVERAALSVPGVTSVEVRLLANSMRVEHEEGLDLSKICEAVKKAGYGASIKGEKQGTAAPAAASAVPGEEDASAALRRVLTSAAFMLPLFYLAMGPMWGWPIPSFLSGAENLIPYTLTQFILALTVCLIHHATFERGFRGLIHLSPTMDTLIALGSAASLLYGVYILYSMGYAMGQGHLEHASHLSMSLYFDSAAMILTLIGLGKYLEARAKGKTGAAIAALVRLQPKTALKIMPDGSAQEVPSDTLREGDRILIRPGSSIPADAEVTEGTAWADESSLTGESLPVEKKVGDTLYASTLLQSGSLTASVTRAGNDTTFARILALVEEAANSKAPISRMADRVSRVFVPAVLGIALVTFIVWLIAGQGMNFAFSCAVSVLVISCPCALGLATPTAIMAATGKGAQIGILYKNAAALEQLGRCDTAVFDKTGTLTLGKPVLSDWQARGDSDSLFRILAALEGRSEHPLGAACVAHAARQKLTLPAVEDFMSLPGKGVSGRVKGKNYLACSFAHAKKEAQNVSEWESVCAALSASGKSLICLLEEGSIRAVAAFSDTMKNSAPTAVQRLRELGVESIMLTGDNAAAARSMADACGIRAIRAEVLPQQKEQTIADLQAEHHTVAMIGDGVNDAPALTRADVGLAIGVGTDAAIESADVLLHTGDLTEALDAMRLSRQALTIIKQNLFWALFYNALCIPLAAGVYYPLWGLQLNPMFGAAAMSLSSICVVTNALRLFRFRPTPRLADPVETPEMIQEEGETPAMKKEIKIEGMMCMHCVAHVKKALEKLPGVTAEVSLENNNAIVTCTQDVSNDTLREAVVDAGYEVISIA